MPQDIRVAVISISALFLCVGAYHRIQSQRSGDPLDRTKEGWPILIGIRLAGLLTFGLTAAWLWNPGSWELATLPVPPAIRWMGVAGYAAGVVWLSWMFRSLGRNLTDTVVTRRDATFVSHGPYRFVRNPMYTGVLLVGLSLGVAMGTWLVPLSAILISRCSRCARRPKSVTWWNGLAIAISTTWLG